MILDLAKQFPVRKEQEHCAAMDKKSAGFAQAIEREIAEGPKCLHQKGTGRDSHCAAHRYLLRTGAGKNSTTRQR
jgi:hypothetical protein